jgi:hypothetical protein
MGTERGYLIKSWDRYDVRGKIERVRKEMERASVSTWQSTFS